MPFTHFPKETFQYFADLAAHNTKEWFEEHREAYETWYLDPAIAFVEAFGPRLRKHSAGVGFEGRKDGRGSNQRIYRDTRFSSDKSPYKDHMMFEFWDGDGKKTAVCGYYVRITQEGLHLLAGAHTLGKSALANFREAADKRGGELRALLDSLLVGDYEQYLDAYAKVPSDYAADHPHAELLKYKNIAVVSPLMPPAQVTAPDFLDRLEGYAAHLAPLNAWMRAELE